MKLIFTPNVSYHVFHFTQGTGLKHAGITEWVAGSDREVRPAETGWHRVNHQVVSNALQIAAEVAF